MLWSRSASLMIRTRMSRAMATTILRTFSACSCSRVRYSMRSSLVSPSTMAPTSAPNPDSMGSRERSVSSTTSCSSADTSVVVSMPRSARMWATPSGWRMKGSPDFRSWPRWDWAAKSKARWTWRTSALGLYARTLRRRPSTPPSSSGPPEETNGRRERRLPRRSGALSSSTRVPPSVHCTGGVARRRDSVGDQGEEVEPRDLLPTLQERQLHQARDANDLAAEALHQLLGLGLGLPRELPGLPDRHEPGPEVVRHGRGQDEAAGLDPHDLVDGPPAEVDHDHVDHRGERHLVGQEGRDVLERHPFLGEVGDVADQGLDPFEVVVHASSRTIVASGERSRAVRLAPRWSAARATIGPRTARVSTYAAVTGASLGCAPLVAPSTAMTMENSPRAVSSAPARRRPRTPTLARVPANQPVPAFVAIPTAARPSAGPRTGGMPAGSRDRPKKAKNTPPNRSRSGVRSVLARSAAGPEMASPTRNAPTAAEIWSCSATPAASSAIPRIERSRVSSERLKITRLSAGPNRTEKPRKAAATATAAATVTIADAKPTPRRRTATTGRYTAITRSSMTRIDSTAGVSRFPTHPISARSLATIPEDEMYVTPASRIPEIGSHPNRNPAARPGAAFSTRSTAPAPVPVRSPWISSRPVYSRPSNRRRRITPISAPISTNASAVTTGTRPPSPKASPASR